jgi:hypothetical protein
MRLSRPKERACNFNHRIAIRALIYVKAVPMVGEGSDYQKEATR